MRRSKLYAAGFLALAYASVLGGCISHESKTHKLTRPAQLQKAAIKATVGVIVLDRPLIAGSSSMAT